MKIDNFYGNIKTDSLEVFKRNNSGFLSYKKPSYTDNELSQKIKDKAREDFLKGEWKKDKDFLKLRYEFISSVSPNRNRIISDGIKKMSFDKNPIHLIDFVELLLNGKVIYTKNNNVVTYAEFYDDNGELVAKFSNGILKQCMTDAENKRAMEFDWIYALAYRDIGREQKSNISNSNFDRSV